MPRRATFPLRGALLALACACFALAPPARADEAARDAEGTHEAGDQRTQAQRIETLDGVTVTGSLAGVVQQVNPGGAEAGARQVRGNFRGDVAVTLPGGRSGDIEGKIFAHVRFGQGAGVVLRPTFTSTANSTAFDTASGSGHPHAAAAEAWYQLTVPHPFRASNAPDTDRLEITAGKIDPFVFFDQNAAADDETQRFMNNAFVHNPLLDSGGDIGADAYGFTPGGRFAYVNEIDEATAWAASIGIFGSGSKADFAGSPADTFVIGQLEATRQWFAHQSGTYRLYAWRNGRADDFAAQSERHSGWGISADQRIGDAVTLFTRVGRTISGNVRFDRALTLGAEIAGSAWQRGDDSVGVAAGWLRTSSAYRAATADGSLAGYAASGCERIVELYYRVRIGAHVDVTPDVQWIGRAGGDASAPDVIVAGVRARVGF